MYISFDDVTVGQFELRVADLEGFLRLQGLTTRQITQLRIHIHCYPHGKYKFWRDKAECIFVPNRNIHVWTYGSVDAEYHNDSLKYILYQYRLFLRGELDDLQVPYENRLSVRLAEAFVVASQELQFLIRKPQTTEEEDPAEQE